MNKYNVLLSKCLFNLEQVQLDKLTAQLSQAMDRIKSKEAWLDIQPSLFDRPYHLEFLQIRRLQWVWLRGLWSFMPSKRSWRVHFWRHRCDIFFVPERRCRGLKPIVRSQLFLSPKPQREPLPTIDVPGPGGFQDRKGQQKWQSCHIAPVLLQSMSFNKSNKPQFPPQWLFSAIFRQFAGYNMV